MKVKGALLIIMLRPQCKPGKLRCKVSLVQQKDGEWETWLTEGVLPGCRCGQGCAWQAWGEWRVDGGKNWVDPRGKRWTVWYLYNRMAEILLQDPWARGRHY